ncbi:LacI family DNA-binding transcriptional regulator [Nesterenkonia sp. PF2B19]|uniref:LacI family DNA-binding transcriptional regulator n=1 Tax=unclassified Nesterenkonia TaxID=2629769 RepID=UPI000871B417|nr:LacI family DNA-binding transcriptional regulator [Nesterenkonia sp. PF2B19]OSM42720.1 LacI family transcriptional regulator [Nesterenkonia sp. PF2B19]
MATRRQAPTMWQVAERAGVSQATVSLVLNKVAGGRVARATQERVWEAVEALGYRTNAHAKSLRSGDSGMIGFISDEVASAPFAGRLLKGAQMKAWESGNVILSVDTFGEQELETASIDMMQSYRVRGVIYAAMYHRRLTVPAALAGLPTVVLNAQDEAGEHSSVFPDEHDGGRRAAQRLIDEGHTRLAMINIQPADSELPAGIGRLTGFRAALEAAGLPFDPELVRYGTGTVEDGLRHAADLAALPEPPTGIFCANDRTAWGAYRALEQRGLGVPDDCSIVGFDNQETTAPHLDPGLTTIELPFEAMAHRAIDLLLDSPDTVQQAPTQGRLIERASVTSPAPRTQEVSP